MTSADIFMRAGRHAASGRATRWCRPTSRGSLKAIAAGGPDAFYRGETAKLIAAEMQRSGGLITAEDLAKYQAVVREPVKGSYRGYDIFSMPPPSSGGGTSSRS